MKAYKRNNFVLILTALLPVIVVLYFFYIQSGYPENVTKVLNSAGENRVELETVIEHYKSGDDSLKLEAAYFLIGNMESHSFVNYALVDTNETVVEFSATDYADYATLTASFDTLQEIHGELDFIRKDKIKDVTTIKADFLINQIDLAFSAWQEKPWAENLSFDNFCEYVLPYRGSNEPLEEWRQALLEKYDTISVAMNDATDPIEAAALINNDVRSYFTFDPRYYYHPTDQSLSEMLASGYGRCEDMTNIAIYALRANALAVTSDYTPYWANTGNNHAWNAILTKDEKVIPFMGAEANPGKYQLANKLAKAYRKMYSEQKNNLYFQERKQEKMPRWLAGKNYKDVTVDYVDVADVTIEFEMNIPDSVDIAYLCVFNSGEWKPIQWGRVKDNSVVFKDMGVDLAYLPALYLNEEIVPYGAPFILNKDQSINKLNPDLENTTTIDITKSTEKKLVVSTDGIKKIFVKEDQQYELYYWNENKWNLFGEEQPKNQSLSFENVPVNGLYWLIEKDSNKEERIFTYEDNRQVWW